MKSLLPFILCLVCVLIAPTDGEAQYKLVYGAFGSGGGMSGGGDMSLHGIFGQTFAGTTQNDAFMVSAGFWYAVRSSLTTSVERFDDTLPHEFRLDQNYPNPFNPSTTIRFALPKQEHATLIVYDVMGRKVATLVDEQLAAGEYSAVFDAGGIASGIYLYRIQAGSHVTTRRMIMVK